MKKIFGVIVIAGALAACNNDGTPTEINLDSLSEKIDTTLEKGWDSTKAVAKEIKEKVGNEIDSLRKDSSN